MSSFGKKVLFLCSIIAILSAWSTFRVDALSDNVSFDQEVFPWLQEYHLTKWTTHEEFRPQDTITRGETAKFVSQYAQAVGLEGNTEPCTFSDIHDYDQTLREFIPQACHYGLLKGSQGKFFPDQAITEAQALAMVVRSVYGYQDETTTPWYLNYITLGNTLGLLQQESLDALATTNIRREKLAMWLYKAFMDEGNEEGFIYETDVESSEDCTSFETYDNQRNVCYFTCDSEEECDDINSQIEEELDSWTEALEDEERVFAEEGSEMTSEQTSEVIYTVTPGEKITKKTGNDLPAYQTIRQEVAELSPNNISDTYMESFEIFNDPESDVLAFVADDDGNGKWHMAINLPMHQQSDTKEQKATIIHELSHIITLNYHQMITSDGACTTYETEEGCTTPTSYLNQFYQKFWKQLNNPEFDDQTFVTEYATTNVEEDIAESFAFFVLESNHQTNTTRNQKVSFFNSFPELVTMRQAMRSVLAKYAIRLKKGE